MRKSAAFFLILISVFSLVSCGGQTKEKVYANTTWHMDTYFSYTLYGKEAEKVFSKLEDIVLRDESIFDCYSQDSEISAVNGTSGEDYMEISQDLYLVLKKAYEGYRLSDMTFDPTIGRLVSLWGFGTDTPSVPSDESVRETLKYIGASKIRLKAEDGHYYLSKPEGMILDLGGIAKGYTLSEMAEELDSSGLIGAVISAGGNVLLYGDREFSVGIRRPHKDALDPVCVFTLESCVVSTTGSYERFFVQNGHEYCHIIDPKSGQSVSGDMVSISVVCEDATDADLWSTSYFVKGIDAAVTAMREGQLEGVILTKDKRIICSEGLAGRLEENSIAEGWTWEVIACEA